MPQCKGLGVVLLQRDKHGQRRVNAYASQSLHPNEKKTRSYSLAKLELLLLKWAIMEKLQDYLFRSKFTVYRVKKPQVYVRKSKSGVAQIRWLSKHALFDFDIKYRTGRLNRTVDALSCYSYVPGEMDRGSDPEEYETIS